MGKGNPQRCSTSRGDRDRLLTADHRPHSSARLDKMLIKVSKRIGAENLPAKRLKSTQHSEAIESSIPRQDILRLLWRNLVGELMVNSND